MPRGKRQRIAILLANGGSFVAETIVKTKLRCRLERNHGMRFIEEIAMSGEGRWSSTIVEVESHVQTVRWSGLERNT